MRKLTLGKTVTLNFVPMIDNLNSMDMEKEKVILEEGILLYDPKVFKGDEEHEYDVECYDGIGFATLVETDNKALPPFVILTYPLRDEVLKSTRQARKVMEYRGLYDVPYEEMTYGDIMICLGKVNTPNMLRKAMERQIPVHDKDEDPAHNRYRPLRVIENAIELGILLLEPIVKATGLPRDKAVGILQGWCDEVEDKWWSSDRKGEYCDFIKSFAQWKFMELTGKNLNVFTDKLS